MPYVGGMVRLRLRKLLQAKGLTPYRLAKTSGLSLKTIYKLTREDGRFDRIAADTMARICQSLDCQPGDLLELSPGGRRC